MNRRLSPRERVILGHLKRPHDWRAESIALVRRIGIRCGILISCAIVTAVVSVLALTMSSGPTPLDLRTGSCPGPVKTTLGDAIAMGWIGCNFNVQNPDVKFDADGNGWLSTDTIVVGSPYQKVQVRIAGADQTNGLPVDVWLPPHCVAGGSPTAAKITSGPNDIAVRVDTQPLGIHSRSTARNRRAATASAS